VPTYPSRAPRKALDVIFATPHLKVVAGPPVVLDDAVLAAASDHRPVWVDLTPGSV
jgi:endonuclease/exonuclease/phosphatase family metal-dependent hydrolase